MSARDEERLARELRGELHDRATDVGGHPVSLDDVRRRAVGIRRRRRGAALAAAAVVLAAVVPVGIGASHLVGRGGSGPDVPAASPDVTPPPTTTPTSPTVAPTLRVPLTTGLERGGGEPAIPYVLDGQLTLTDGEVVPLPADTREVAQYGEGWLVLREGQQQAVVLDRRGERTGTVDLDPDAGLAVAPDETLTAYVDPGGNPTVTAGDGNVLTLGSLPTRNARVVGVYGGAAQCSGSCFVAVASTDTPRSWVLDARGRVDQLPLQKVVSVTSDGLLDGTTSTSDGGSCSAVVRRDGTTLWRTCDYTLGRFSPDGGLVLGHPAYLDGAGDRSLAILDARTGDVLVEYAVPGRADVLVRDSRWESPTSVVASVWDTDHWTLMRMGSDGVLGEISKGGVSGGTRDEPPVSFLVAP